MTQLQCDTRWTFLWSVGFAMLTATSSHVGVAMGQDPVVDESRTLIFRDEFRSAMRDALEAGEIDDPALRDLSAIEIRPVPLSATRGGGPIPTMTRSDIFSFEDTAGLLLTNYSDGQLFDLQGQAIAAMIVEHGDIYDFAGIYINFVPFRQIGAAFYQGLFNDVTGIGDLIYDDRALVGLGGTAIQGYVMMWHYRSWPTTATSKTQLVLGQEFEHRFAMFLAPLAGGRPLQGDDAFCGRSAHWNFKVDGQGSGMEMSEWTGAPTATRITSGAPFTNILFNTDIGGVFSYPDLYLMGTVSGAEMDAGASELRYMEDLLQCTSPYSGTISTWSSADIIASNGPRVPDSTTAQQDFRTGWIMIHQPGSPPTNDELDCIVATLNNWTTVYNIGTLGRGTMNNTLFLDCNNNLTDDHDEVIAGSAFDCDGDVVLDSCEINEPGADTNGNNTLDACEILPGDAIVLGTLTNNAQYYDGTTGEFKSSLFSGPINPQSMRIGPDGLLYIQSLAQAIINRYDPTTGTFVDTFITAAQGLQVPSDMVWGPDGLLYVFNRGNSGNQTVKRYDPVSGAFVDRFVFDVNGTPVDETGGLITPEFLAFGPNGDLYATDQATGTVFQYDGADGTFLGMFVADDPGTPGVNEAGGLSSGQEMIFHTDGLLYVASGNTNQVLRFDDTTGAFVDVFVGDDPSTPGVDESGGLVTPHGIIFGPDGSFYVTARISNQVLRYDGLTGAFIDVYLGNNVATACDESKGINWATSLAFVPGPPPIPGDLDGNGIVNLVDFAIFATCFGLSQPNAVCDAEEFAGSDLTGNGVVDLNDFAIFALNFGT